MRADEEPPPFDYECGWDDDHEAARPLLDASGYDPDESARRCSRGWTDRDHDRAASLLTD